jgi:hypothetical protein
MQSVKIRPATAGALSISDQIKFHRSQADFYARKFNALPMFYEKRRELAQMLCEAHTCRVIFLQVQLAETVTH